MANAKDNTRERWPRLGQTRFEQKGGFASIDRVTERKENQYWKIQVDSIQSWMLGFQKFVGEWETSQIQPNRIRVNYSYTLHSNVALLNPLNWLYANTFWKFYMKQVLENVRHMAYQNEPYLYG